MLRDGLVTLVTLEPYLANFFKEYMITVVTKIYICEKQAGIGLERH